MKVEVAVLVSPSLIVRRVSVDVEQYLTATGSEVGWKTRMVGGKVQLQLGFEPGFL